jgi:hypothetical protein
VLVDAEYFVELHKKPLTPLEEQAIQVGLKKK